MLIAYDADGYFAGDFPDDIPPDGTTYTDAICPQGFIKPKFDGEKWIEGGVKSVPFIPES